VFKEEPRLVEETRGWRAEEGDIILFLEFLFLRPNATWTTSGGDRQDGSYNKSGGKNENGWESLASLGHEGGRATRWAKHRDCRSFPLATRAFLNFRVALALREPHVLRIDTISAQTLALVEELLGWRASNWEYNSVSTREKSSLWKGPPFLLLILIR